MQAQDIMHVYLGFRDSKDFRGFNYGKYINKSKWYEKPRKTIR